MTKEKLSPITWKTKNGHEISLTSLNDDYLVNILNTFRTLVCHDLLNNGNSNSITTAPAGAAQEADHSLENLDTYLRKINGTLNLLLLEYERRNAIKLF